MRKLKTFFDRVVKYGKSKQFAAFDGFYLFKMASPHAIYDVQRISLPWHRFSLNFSKLCLKGKRTAAKDGICSDGKYF